MPEDGLKRAAELEEYDKKKYKRFWKNKQVRFRGRSGFRVL
jgi:hypothetical protein